MKWHSLSLDEIFSRLGTGKNGLSEKDAFARLEHDGPNVIGIKEHVSRLRIFLEQFESPLVIILIGAALFSYLIGFVPGQESRAVDAILIMAIVFANGIFGFFQDYKAEKSIEELKKLSAPECTVIRAGRKIRISSEKLVRGDIVFIEEGQVVPADCRVTQSNNLKVDESLLTGESDGVAKKVSVLDESVPLAERNNMLWMNTMVIRGTCIAVVVETGLGTEVGNIAREIKAAEKPMTPFQREIAGLGKKIGAGVVGIIALIAGVQFFMGAGNLFTIFMISIALAVAAIPEGLPAVVTLSLAMGTRKMIAKKALVRKLPVVESLGSIDVICTDKTGTLTENRMTVRKIYFGNKVMDIGRKQGKGLSKALPLFRAGVICNNASMDNNGNQTGDPTEIALLASAKDAGIEKEHEFKRLHEIPFSSERKRMTVIAGHGSKTTAFMKGAPETVLARCSRIMENGKILELTEKRKSDILRINSTLSSECLRVLGFAQKGVAKGKYDESSEKGMIFLGLQAMHDPPRKGVKQAVSQCKTAGIRTVMITGDNIETAKAIAREIGMKADAMQGSEIENMNDSELSQIVEKYGIFARVSPEHKVRVLKALQGNGHRVAITGDGVNDAPALKSSDVGVSMGMRGSDVAKAASDMTLLDDNFSTIVSAIKEGRTIFENIKKFVVYLLTCNFAEVFVVFFASLFGYIAITPVQLLWINLLTDGAPAIALAADPANEDIMKKSPRNRKEGVITKSLACNIAAIGTIMTVTILLVFWLGMGTGIATAQTMAFTSFVIYEFVRIGSIRYQEKLSWNSNKYLLLAVTGSLIMQLAIIYSPLNSVFGIVPLGVYEWMIILIGAAAGFAASIITTRFFCLK